MPRARFGLAADAGSDVPPWGGGDFAVHLRIAALAGPVAWALAVASLFDNGAVLAFLCVFGVVLYGGCGLCHFDVAGAAARDDYPVLVVCGVPRRSHVVVAVTAGPLLLVTVVAVLVREGDATWTLVVLAAAAAATTVSCGAAGLLTFYRSSARGPHDDNGFKHTCDSASAKAPSFPRRRHRRDDSTRRCAKPGCKKAAKHTCSVCESVYYCSPQHQLDHWPAHKQECSAATRAAPSPPATPLPPKSPARKAVCAMPGCAKAAAHMCSACESVYYCSAEHQMSHWPTHKAACRPSATDSRQPAATAPPQSGSSRGLGRFGWRAPAPAPATDAAGEFEPEA